ncbi:hypothetical protein E2C06_15875 [Dankookia rubra]|uniref:Uncharacterized protein n=1 Tax=Dankookia rubra TaxID=1442381 RepID=A0A4R5QFX4_9PROT|nr:hypothetical protein [Dankookia rubra]TDH61609.1 hypothetical protein E2C06_15875 [Dankookia rubra]
MTCYRPRIWLGLGISVLLAGAADPVRAADPGCVAAAPAPLGEAGESGEAGEGGPATPASRALLLDRMAAQIEGAAAARAAGDAESADILVAAATDEGPARLARRGDGPDAALEATLAPLAAAPADAAAKGAALRAVETAIPTTPPVERAAGLTALALEAFGAAQECGRLTDRAAYAEAQALARRALGLLRALPGQAAQEMVSDLSRLTILLPVQPPAALPAMGAVSALVSHALLAASDAGR